MTYKKGPAYRVRPVPEIEEDLDSARKIYGANVWTLFLRTFLPKINTVLLHQIKKGRFEVLSAHEVLKETRHLIEK